MLCCIYGNTTEDHLIISVQQEWPLLVTFVVPVVTCVLEFPLTYIFVKE